MMQGKVIPAWINEFVGIALLLAVALLFFGSVYTQYSAILAQWIGPTLFLVSMAYFLNLYRRRIDDVNGRLIELEGRLKSYENLGVIQKLYKEMKKEDKHANPTRSEKKE